MAMYNVFVKTYGYASQFVEANSKAEAIEIARNNPNEWGSSGYTWWQDDNNIIKVDEVRNINGYVPVCVRCEVEQSTTLHGLMNKFADKYAPQIKALNALKGFNFITAQVTDYGEVDADICDNMWYFVHMVTMNGAEQTPNSIPTLMVDFLHCDKDTNDAIIACIKLNKLSYCNESEFIRVECHNDTELECLVGILARFQTKHYKWVASSDDGCYEVDSQHLFTDKCLCYCDMRNAALARMKWNTEYDEDFADVCDGDYIGYEVQFYQDKIIHKSYSGTYTYKIIEC